MKIKSGFVLEEVGGSYLACATGKLASEFSALVRLNSSGAFLWRIIAEKPSTEKELSCALISEYGIDEATAQKDVSAFVKILRDNGILES